MLSNCYPARRLSRRKTPRNFPLPILERHKNGRNGEPTRSSNAFRLSVVAIPPRPLIPPLLRALPLTSLLSPTRRFRHETCPGAPSRIHSLRPSRRPYGPVRVRPGPGWMWELCSHHARAASEDVRPPAPRAHGAQVRNASLNSSPSCPLPNIGSSVLNASPSCPPPNSESRHQSETWRPRLPPRRSSSPSAFANREQKQDGPPPRWDSTRA